MTNYHGEISHTHYNVLQYLGTEVGSFSCRQRQHTAASNLAHSFGVGQSRK